LIDIKENSGICAQTPGAQTCSAGPLEDQAMPFSRLFDRFAADLLPADASDPVRLKFASLARYASAHAGDAPFRGNGHDQIIFVASGSTKLVAHASGGREQVVAFHFAGDLVCVPARAAHAYSLYALEECELIYFPSDQFLHLAVQEAGMAGNMLDRALHALARCREKAIALGRKTARERLAGFLYVMADRIGAADGDACVIDLPMSRRDIGDSLGLTIETVSRQFTELRDRGLLETLGRSRVRLFDIAGLNAQAGHLPVAA
jgi:CRP/FNR family transcriptional regulator